MKDYFYIDYEDSISECGETLYRIVYTKDIHDFLQTPGIQIDVKKGDLGGYVVGYENIDQDTSHYSYINANSKLFSNARVSGSVIIDSVLNHESYINNSYIDASTLTKSIIDSTMVYDSDLQNINAIKSTIDSLVKHNNDKDAIVVSHHLLGGYYIDESGEKVDKRVYTLNKIPKRDWRFMETPLIYCFVTLMFIYIFLNS